MFNADDILKSMVRGATGGSFSKKKHKHYEQSSGLGGLIPGKGTLLTALGVGAAAYFIGRSQGASGGGNPLSGLFGGGTGTTTGTSAPAAPGQAPVGTLPPPPTELQQGMFPPPPLHVATVTAPQQAFTPPTQDRSLLLIRAMIAAANADHHIDAEERRRILGKSEFIGLSGEQRQFLETEFDRPSTISALAREVGQDADLARQVYVMSLLAIDLDDDAERAYLARLAQALQLPVETVAEVHRLAQG
jgi:uncharacterized membrane protein YebE (DUF533 family)